MKSLQVDDAIHDRLRATVEKINGMKNETEHKMTMFVFVARAIEKEIKAYERHFARLEKTK